VAGPYVSEAATQLTAVTFTAMNATNGNKITMPGRRILIIFNNTNVAAQHVTIAASNDPYGRSAPITQLDIPAGSHHSRWFFCGPDLRAGWLGADVGRARFAHHARIR